MRIQETLKTVLESVHFANSESNMKLAIMNACSAHIIEPFDALDAYDAVCEFLHPSTDFNELVVAEYGQPVSSDVLTPLQVKIYSNWEKRDFLFQDFIENY